MHLAMSQMWLECIKRRTSHKKRADRLEETIARSLQESTRFMPQQTTKLDQTILEPFSTAPTLPTEIWLQILEFDEPKHLWLSVRKISRAYKDLAERLFTSRYLHRLKVALSLPRRDSITSKLKWPGDPLPQSQLVMKYTRLISDGKRLRLESPIAIKYWNGEKTLDELRQCGTVPKERLEEAPPNVNMSRHPMGSLTIKLPVHVEWDDMVKVWVWEVDWRALLSHFFAAKDKQGKRWPTTARSTAPQELPWRSRRA